MFRKCLWPLQQNISKGFRNASSGPPDKNKGACHHHLSQTKLKANTKPHSCHFSLLVFCRPEEKSLQSDWKIFFQCTPLFVVFVLIVKKYIFHINEFTKSWKKRMTELLEHPSLWTIYYALLPDLGLSINKKNKVKMGEKLCRHIKSSSWWKAVHWWMICLQNQFFITNVRFTVLHCRSTEICCWNKHGTSWPSHGTQIWLVWEGRKMDEDCLGWVVRRPGEAAVLCYICMKCLGSEKAAPVWIEIQTQSAY